MCESENFDLEIRIREALGTPPAADFDAWQRRHGDSLACLSPALTATQHRRRVFLIRIASATAAAAGIVAVAVWGFSSDKRTFAQTINTIEKAETITWTITWYDRMYSTDRERTWLRVHPRWERSYLSPNKWRDVRYNSDGSVAFVDIEDASTGEVLHLNMVDKEAVLKNEPSGQFGRGGPFEGLRGILDSKPIEFAGQRQVDGVRVNVFRYVRGLPDGGTESTEFWLDEKTERLVGYCVSPGDVFFDPRTAPDRENSAEDDFSQATNAGVIVHDIVYDAQLDPSSFSMTPPEGFTVIESPQRPNITEE